MKKWYGYFQILSLDVVTGAIASGGMAARILDVEMPAVWWWALPISVWVIYTLDHLLDAYRLKEHAHTQRHLFHYRHFTIISAIWSVLFLVCILWIPFQLPEKILWLGLGLGMFVLFHLGMVQWVGGKISWLLQKELGVGLIYALGVWGGPLVMAGATTDKIAVILFIQFFLIALINLMLFSLFDLETDTRDAQTSFVRAIGEKKTVGLVGGLALLTTACILLVWRQLSPLEWVVEAVYGGMLGVLWVLMVGRNRFRENESYRVWGDGIFYFPFLLWAM